jgi:hypothetical protein
MHGTRSCAQLQSEQLGTWIRTMADTQHFHLLFSRVDTRTMPQSHVISTFETRSVGQGALPEITNSTVVVLIDVIMWRITP